MITLHFSSFSTVTMTSPSEGTSFVLIFVTDMTRSGRKCRGYESDATTITSESTDDAGDDELTHDARTVEQPRTPAIDDQQQPTDKRDHGEESRGDEE